MTKIEIWAADASYGESFVYASMDRDKRPRKSSMQAAARLYVAGMITMVQRREADGSISYIAQRTRPQVLT